MVKITKLPPAEQDVFFQDVQFDPGIGEGTDPILYWRGVITTRGKKGRGFKSPDPNQEVQTQNAKQSRRAEEAIEGHENEKKILKILKSRNV